MLTRGIIVIVIISTILTITVFLPLIIYCIWNYIIAQFAAVGPVSFRVSLFISMLLIAVLVLLNFITTGFKKKR